MHDTDQKRLRQHVQRWKHAGPKLVEIKRRELRAFDYATNRDLIDGMLQWACEHAQPRWSTGLVEQQRHFMKLRKPETATPDDEEAAP